MMNYEEAKYWLYKNMPELNSELGPMHWHQVRIRMNQETGLDIKGHDLIPNTFPRYVEVLKARISNIN